MNDAQIFELVGLAIEQIAKLVERGIPHEEALRRVARLADDVEQIDRDVDQAASGR